MRTWRRARISTALVDKSPALGQVDDGFDIDLGGGHDYSLSTDVGTGQCRVRGRTGKISSRAVVALRGTDSAPDDAVSDRRLKTVSGLDWTSCRISHSATSAAPPRAPPPVSSCAHWPPRPVSRSCCRWSRRHAACTNWSVNSSWLAPLVSQHLRVLKDAGVVRGERNGREIMYSLVDHHLAHIVTDALVHATESEVLQAALAR